MPRARVLLVRAVSSSVRTPFGQRLMSCNMGGTGPECSDTPLQDDPKGRKTSTKSPPAALWSLMPKANLNRTALVCTKSGQEVSHRELQDMSLSFAGRLTRDLGYAVGDKLALVLGSNCIENVIVQLGAAAAGITVVTADKPEDRMLEGCRGLVVSANVLKERAPQVQDLKWAECNTGCLIRPPAHCLECFAALRYCGCNHRGRVFLRARSTRRLSRTTTTAWVRRR